MDASCLEEGMNQFSKGVRIVAIVLPLLTVSAFAAADGHSKAKKTWAVKADYIEACSCNLFCQCYFAPHPEGEAYCDFDNAVKIREGHVGDVKVDGLKFWL